MDPRPERTAPARADDAAGDSADPAARAGAAASEAAAAADPISVAAGSSSSVLRRLAERTGASQRYRVEGEIARGGMGAILQAWDENLRRTLAMKVALARRGPESSGARDSSSSRLIDRFLEEAQITGQLDHPGIVPVHELGLDSEGRLFFTMRLVKGRDLAAIYADVHAGSSEWTRTRALGVLLKVCEAMAFAHEKRVIHRDLKPANVMVGRFGETYVMDWGLARVIGREDAHDVRLRDVAAPLSIVHTDRAEERAAESPLVTMDGDVVGTPCYMAPEQARGKLEEIGPQSDVYSAGAMLHHLISGQMPYVAPGERVAPHEVLERLLLGSPAALRALAPHAPEELVAICEKAMARDPRDRYATMLEMADDLRAFLEDRVVRAYQTGPVAEIRKWIRRNRAVAAASAAAVVLAVAGLATVVVVQSRANEALRLAKDEVEEARDEAVEAQEELATANVALGAARDEADARARDARVAGHAANVAAGSASLRVAEAADARRRLEACDPALRGWEWRYLALAADPSLRRLDTGASDAASVAFHPDGELVAVASTDGLLRILRASDGELVRAIAPEDGLPNVLAFTPDGARIACGSRDKSIHVFDVESGASAGRFGDHEGAIVDLAFSPDGALAATASTDKRVRLFDVATGALVRTLEGHTSSVTSLAFGRGGALLASGSRDRTVRVWETATGALARTFAESEHSVAFVAFDPEGARLIAGFATPADASGEAIGRGANSVRMWSVDDGALRGVFAGPSLQITHGGFHPSGSAIFACSLDSTVWLWDLRAGRDQVLLGHGFGVLDAAFSRRGGELVTAGQRGETRLWAPELRTGFALRGHGGQVTGVAFAHGGERLVTAGHDFTLRSWSTRSGLQESVLRGHVSFVLAVAASADGSLLASASTDGTARVWDAASGRELARIGEEHTLGIATSQREVAQCVAFDPAGRRLAVARVGRDGEGVPQLDVVIWDAVEQRELRRIAGEPGYPVSLAWAPDGEHVVVGSVALSLRSMPLQRWSAAAGTLVARRDWSRRICALAFAPDGSLAAAIGEKVMLLAPDDLADRRALIGHEGGVRGVAFSPDGRRVATASEDDSVRIWDYETGETLLALPSPGGDVVDVEFSPDGSQLAAAPSDWSAQLWCTRAVEERASARRAASASRQTVLPVLDALFESFADPALVVERLRNDPTVEATQLRAAASLALLAAPDAAATEREAWRAVRVAGEPVEDVHVALWSALVATREDPTSERAQLLLGAARYRLGELDEALAALERANELRKSRGRVEVLAFLAMARHRAGESAASDEAYRELLGLMQVPAQLLQPENQALLRETEATRARPAGR